MMKTKKEKNLVIYQAKSGAIELRGDFTRETIWATQAQIADIFSIDRTVATKHIGNIIKIKEVDKKSNVQKMHIANSDKPVTFYSLDIILAVGYRANSARAIQFRQWATKTLREHITKGFTVNPKIIKHNYAQFLSVVDDIKKLLPAGPEAGALGAVELVSLFADTWLSLDAYDRDALPKGKLTKKKVELTAEKITGNLVELKKELVRKKEATELFGQERSSGSVAGIVGNVMQSFGGKELYPTVEQKAVHLLYFMVKNHPFSDGNKRSGAFAFVWFLEQAKILNTAKLTPTMLTTLTILVASSEPKDKDKVIDLILNLISKGT
jgi:prophage maintenance system killer protein